jgi:hypothetical protein
MKVRAKQNKTKKTTTPSLPHPTTTTTHSTHIFCDLIGALEQVPDY